MDKCDFCQEIKQVERTYLYPSKYVKEQGAFINKTLYNDGDYFIIVKTCADCGTPTSSKTSSQTEISDEEIEEQSWGYREVTKDMEIPPNEDWSNGAKWYKEKPTTL